jgi:hypothetical protein
MVPCTVLKAFLYSLADPLKIPRRNTIVTAFVEAIFAHVGLMVADGLTLGYRLAMNPR